VSAAAARAEPWWCLPRRLLPGLWAGALLSLALIASTTVFALLPPSEGGRLASRMLMIEAYLSLALGAVMLVLERAEARRTAASGTGSQFSVGMLLALGALFCTVAGYFGVVPAMHAARAGQGGFNLGTLHGVSVAFFGLKTLLVLALAWLVARRPTTASS
jgi:hypothetical protein